jgi:hypothetical protein
MDWAASSAVSLPISNASLRSIVIWIGVGSTRCTYSGARVPPPVHFYNKFNAFHTLSPQWREESLWTIPAFSWWTTSSLGDA